MTRYNKKRKMLTQFLRMYNYAPHALGSLSAVVKLDGGIGVEVYYICDGVGGMLSWI
jgi:hypothetical protein